MNKYIYSIYDPYYIMVWISHFYIALLFYYVFAIVILLINIILIIYDINLIVFNLIINKKIYEKLSCINNNYY